MKHLFCFILFLFASISLMQAQQQVSGTVRDSRSAGLPYVNMLLYRGEDTTILLKGTITDSVGYYRFEQLERGTYLLRAMFIGYEPAQQKFDLSGNAASSPIFDLTLEDDTIALHEIIVRGEKPALKVEPGKLVYHLPSLLRNKPVTNVYEAICEIPGVMKQNEYLTLIGTNSVLTVLLNGQKTSMNHEQLTAVLKSLPVSRVEDIEVMHSAPPQYNIRGAAVNVLLKQTANEETANMWQGELAGVYLQRSHASANGRVSLLYQSKQISIDMLYANRYTDVRNREDKENDHALAAGNRVAVMEDNDGRTKNRIHNIRVASSITLKNRNKVELTYTGLFDCPRSHRFSNVNLSKQDIHSDTYIEGASILHNVKADYRSHFGLVTGIDYTNYDDKSEQQLSHTNLMHSSRSDQYSTDSRQKISRLFMYANQKHVLSGNWQLNYGLNYSHTVTDNRSDGMHNDTIHPSSTFTNCQKENIWNVFFGGSKTFSQQFSLQASIAVEYYKSIEKSDERQQTLWDDMALFPSLNATYLFPSMTHILQLSISSDKSYPSYWVISPMIRYLNVYSEIHGNPYLKPSRSYDINLNYIFKRKYVMSTFVNYRPDAYRQLFYQQPSHLNAEAKFHNLNYERIVGIATIIPFKIGQNIQSKATLSGMKMTQKCDRFYDIPFNRSKWLAQIKWDNDVIIAAKPDIRLNISGTYTSPAIQGIYDLGESYNVSGGIMWTFDRKHAQLILKATDIFQSSIPSVMIDYKGQKGSFQSYQDMRSLSLSFIYHFGGFKEPKRKELDTSRFGGL